MAKGKVWLLCLVAAVLVLMLALPSTGSATILFTADTDNSLNYPNGQPSISVPAKNNHIPGISPGVTLTPATAMMGGVATGPLNGITYGPSGPTHDIYFSFAGTTGWVNTSYTFSVGGTMQIIWEVANVYDNYFPSALAIDKIRLNNVIIPGFDFESGFPSGWTLLGTGGTSTAITNLSPTYGNYFGWIDTTGIINPIYDQVYGFNGSRLYSAAFQVNAGNVLSMNLAFLTTDGFDDGTWVHDYAIAEVKPIPLPGTLVLLGSGLMGLAGLGYRRIK